MQLANKDYIHYLFSNDPTIEEPKDWRLPLWEYIREGISFAGYKIDYLIDLFDISKTTLNSWQNGTRQVSQDKLVIIANLLGVTIDQLLDRDLNDDYVYECWNELMTMLKRDDYKGMSYSDLSSIFEKLAEACAMIDYYSLGYIPSDDNNCDEPEEERYHIDYSLLKYYCQSLEFEVNYELKSGEKMTLITTSYEEIVRINDRLADEWGSDAPKHIVARRSKKYDKILLLSENYKYLNYLAGYWKLDLNYYLNLWLDLKKNDPDYDDDNNMAKVLIARGAKVVTGDLVDENKTHELINQIIKDDVKRIVDNKKED